MEKICKFCKWWEENTGKYDQIECGECKDTHFIYTGEGEKTPSNGLGYWDYESYRAGFETGSHFGCIHFVKNEKITAETEKSSETEVINPDELEIL